MMITSEEVAVAQDAYMDEFALSDSKNLLRFLEFYMLLQFESCLGDENHCDGERFLRLNGARSDGGGCGSAEPVGFLSGDGHGDGPNSFEGGDGWGDGDLNSEGKPYRYAVGSQWRRNDLDLRGGGPSFSRVLAVWGFLRQNPVRA
jgi:hypothetical protein